MSSTTARTARRLAALAGALAVLGLPACSGEDHSGSAASSASEQAAVNDADVAFAQGMVPHHEQAVEMARLADERAQDPAVRDLAERIEAAQAPEITTLTGWLDEWGATPHAGEEGGMHHGGGMMSADDMDALTGTTGTEFDRLFLEQMIEHHTGAVGMAETEIAEGRHEGAIGMAEEIRSTQNAEITEMQDLLDQLGQ